MISFCGKIQVNTSGNCIIKVCTENLTVAIKYFMLLKKTFDVQVEVMVRNSQSSTYYHIVIYDHSCIQTILKGMSYSSVIKDICCKRSFIRGAFMAAGSITDPSKSYHFEIVTSNETMTEQLIEILKSFQIDAKYMIRKKNFVIYVKEGSQIADILNIMEAHVALMNLENVRIYKEMRNTVKRKVNCKEANITKTTEAAIRQQQDILYIKDNMGFGNLSEQLQEIAQLRIRYSDASLKELGDMLHPPLGKSGVNHRLRRLSEIADNLRGQKEEDHVK